jgi:glycosyltransferase involved in cell wall biosynthesis
MGVPLVSVIIPAFNSGAYLDETLRSAAGQTHGALEVIVVDDGSNDASVEAIAARFPGVQYVRQVNAGGNVARNTGLRLAQGDFIAFLDHDDVWEPDKLEVQLAVAARHPESGLIACDGIQFDANRTLSQTLFHGPLAERLMAAPGPELTGSWYPDFFAGSPISCPAQTLIPRDVVDDLGPLTLLRHEPSDLEYYLRIAARYPVTLHKDRLVRWRYLPTSHSGPLSRRWLNWALMNVPMLRRHRPLCPPEHRTALAAALRSWTHGAARGAYKVGREEDRRWARAYLRRLRRAAPLDPVVLLYSAALECPPSLATHLARSARRLRRPRPR